VASVGFDVALAGTLAATARLGARRSPRLGMAAVIGATLLVVDAWFECLTARRGAEYLTSITAAVFLELPLAAALV
jgi:hypothetical protein